MDALSVLGELKERVEKRGVVHECYVLAHTGEVKNCAVGHALSIGGMTVEELERLDDASQTVRGIYGFTASVGRESEQAPMVKAQKILKESGISELQWLRLQRTNDRILDDEWRKTAVIKVIDELMDEATNGQEVK